MIESVSSTGKRAAIAKRVGGRGGGGGGGGRQGWVRNNPRAAQLGPDQQLSVTVQSAHVWLRETQYVVIEQVEATMS